MAERETSGGMGTTPTDLLPCPFCGGDAEIVKNDFPSRNPWRHPSCKDANCPGFVMEQDERGGTNCDVRTDEEAVALWNRRANDQVEFQEGSKAE